MTHVIRPDFGETRLDALQRHAFAYFLNETNPANGLIRDRTEPAGVERAWMTRSDAIERTLARLGSRRGRQPRLNRYRRVLERPCVRCFQRRPESYAITLTTCRFMHMI